MSEIVSFRSAAGFLTTLKTFLEAKLKKKSYKGEVARYVISLEYPKNI